jgi:hypothetical protein
LSIVDGQLSIVSCQLFMSVEQDAWIDSGSDCDHCGGELLRLAAKRPLLPNDPYYRCRACGCEWTQRQEIVRLGDGPHCHLAQGQRPNPSSPASPPDWLARLKETPRWLLFVAVGLLLLLALRFAAFSFILLRLLIPLAVIGLVLYLVHRFGQEQRWW